MSLLREIQKDLLNTEFHLSDVLRKAMVLAYQLKSEELKVWASNEMDGYKGDPNSVPEYRILETQSYGHFAGAFGREIRNAIIPTVGLPKEAEEFTTTLYLMNGIRELESWLENGERSFKFNWPANSIVAVAKKNLSWLHMYGSLVDSFTRTSRTSN
jgi:hypothetical protein